MALSILLEYKSISPIDNILTGSTTLYQSGPGSQNSGNERVLHTP